MHFQATRDTLGRFVFWNEGPAQTRNSEWWSAEVSTISLIRLVLPRV